MKVLLKQDIDRLGRMGEVVEVAHGYARNYLIPRGFAAAVTRGGLKDIQEQQRILEVKAARLREGLEEIATKLKSKPVVIKARCSASGKLFGSITNRQLASQIKELFNEDIDRHNIHVDERIRSVGVHHALVKLHHDVELDLEFEVEGEGFEAEEPQEEEEAAVVDARQSGAGDVIEEQPVTELSDELNEAATLEEEEPAVERELDPADGSQSAT